MKDIFRRVPLREWPDYSSSHRQAGHDYEARFKDRPGRAGMWALERELIRKVFPALAPRRLLDFATGTGRIAAELEQCLPQAELHGIDISEDMLALARAKCPRVRFHALDGRQALSAFGKESFDTVSAFRFFANADPGLRQDVAAQIAALVKPGGYVVLNNHRNFWSTSYMAMRLAGYDFGNFGSCNSAIRKLFLHRGFFSARRYSLGIWPQTDSRALFLPWPAVDAVERFNLRHLTRAHTLGYNTVFILQKRR